MSGASTNTGAVMFPGQGSQEKGMGKDIAEHYSEVMDLWKKGEQIAGAPLREIYWEGDESAMTETSNQQPALVITSLGLWRVLSSNIRPQYFSGHSIGEYTALIASGVLDWEQALELVCLRGRLMSEAGRTASGKMAAILKLSQETVQQIVDQASEETGETLLIANYNTPYQLVVSGAENAVEKAMALAKQNKGKPVALPVSGAFHSPLMNEAAQELAGFMEKLHWKKPGIPVHLNVTAREETNVDNLLANMQKQMISPVYWTQLILDQWDKGARKWWEIGPKKVLTNLVKNILRDSEENWEVENVGSLEDINKLGLETQ